MGSSQADVEFSQANGDISCLQGDLSERLITLSDRHGYDSESNHESTQNRKLFTESRAESESTFLEAA